MFVYLGPAPSFTGCSQNVWIASGNLIGSTDGRFDTSQVQAGTQISTYAQALALVGAYPVTGISIVVDSSFAFDDDKEQTLSGAEREGEFLHVLHAPAAAARRHRHERRPGVQAVSARDGPDRVPARRTGRTHNKANAFGKCVSKMAKLKTDALRASAVDRIDAAADRCAERTTAGKGKGKAKGKAKGQAKQLAKCLKRAV